MSSSEDQLVFGFLPAAVLQNINELGNWKTRSSAIEQVQHDLASLGPSQVQVLQQQLPEFVAFVQQLLQDHNFKVVTAGLHVLADASSSLGPELQHHMGDLAPVLLSKLLDHRAPVAAAALQAAAQLMKHTTQQQQPSNNNKNHPAAGLLVNRLLSLQQSGAAAATASTTAAAGGASQDCSGLIELLILALLKGAQASSSSLDLPAAAGLLLKCIEPPSSGTTGSSSSSSGKQHALAMEALALLTDSLGAGLPNLLKQAGGTDLTVTLVLTQVQQLQRPLLGADGSSIQHTAAAQAAIAAAEATNSALASTSFRLGTGLYDRTSNSSVSSFRSDSSLGGGATGGLKSVCGLSSSSKGGASAGGGQLSTAVDALGRPLSGSNSSGSNGSHEQQQQQMLPPGSLGALAAHARLLSNAAAAASSSGGGGGVSSSSGGVSSRPVSGASLGQGRTSNHGQDGRSGGGRLGLSINSNTSIGGHDLTYTAGRSPLGSPRAAPTHSSSEHPHGFSHLQPAEQQHSSTSPPSPSQPQQLRTQLSKLQLYDSSRYPSNRQDSQQQQDAADAAKAAAAGGQGANLRYQQQQQPNSNAVHACRDTADQACSPSADTSSAAAGGGAAGAGRGTSGTPTGSSSSASGWLAAAGPGWASPDPTASADASGSGGSSSYCPGRQETLSPSRGERLAQLKRRQVEKRAVSATGSSRGPSGIGWVPSCSPSSQSGSGGAAAAAAAACGSGSGSGGFLYSGTGGGGGIGGGGAADTGEYVGPRAATAGAVLPAAAAGAGAYGGGWRASTSSSSESQGGAAMYANSGGSGRQPGSQSLCSSPAPGGDDNGGSVFVTQQHGAYNASGSGSSSRGALLQWHIPTGPGGRVLPPGSSSSNQQQQQSSRRYTGDNSPEQQPGSPVIRGQMWDSPRSSAEGGGSSSGGGGGGIIATAGQRGSNHAASGAAGMGGAQHGGSSRFQQTRSGSASPADGQLLPSSFHQGQASVSGSSRLHSGAAGSAIGFGRQQQQQQPQQGLRAQTAAPALGAATASGASGGAYSLAGTGEWGTGGTSSPASRLSSACGPAANGSGCFSSGSGPGATAAAASSSSMSGGGGNNTGTAGSPIRSPGGLSSRAGGSIRGLLSGGERPQSGGVVNEAEVAGADLAQLSDPAAGLRQAVAKLQQATAATRKEVDWQAQLDALVDARRLIAHHTEVLRPPAARELVLAALPSVDDLRSTTSRMALLFFQELPGSGVGIERELDDVVPVLLKKAGDLSTAGRDNFLAQEAAKALSLICSAVSEARALSSLISAGASHKSPHVRSRAAAHLDEVAAGGRGLEGLLRSGSWAVLDKLFKTAAAFLQEGSLDTRTYGKRLLWAVKAVLRGNRADMDRLMAGITPEGVHRRVVEVLEGLSGPPPPPANRGAASAGPRLASRGQVSGCSTPVSAGTLSGLQTAPLSAPPGSLFMAGGASSTGVGGGHDGPYSASRPTGYSSAGSTSGGNGAARRALFSGGSGSSSNTSLQVHGAAAATLASPGSSGSPGSPTALSNSASGRRRRSTATALADIGRGAGGGGGGVSSPSASSACGSPAAYSSSGAAAAFGSGGFGSTSGNDRRVSVGCPAGPPGPMGLELQEAVDQVGLQLCSKDWRNRMDALRGLSALGPALPEVPNAPLEGLLQALIGRLSDGNAKVNQKALEVLCEVVCSINLRTMLIMSSLMPALTGNLGSTNDKLRGGASIALDVVTAAVSPSPQTLVQGFAQAIANGSVRTKVAVIDKLESLLPVLHAAHPQLTRLLLPAAFSLAGEARGEAKAAAAQLMCSLASLLGSPPILSAAGNVSSATEQRVRELLLGGTVGRN